MGCLATPSLISLKPDPVSTGPPLAMASPNLTRRRRRQKSSLFIVLIGQLRDASMYSMKIVRRGSGAEPKTDYFFSRRPKASAHGCWSQCP